MENQIQTLSRHRRSRLVALAGGAAALALAFLVSCSDDGVGPGQDDPTPVLLTIALAESRATSGDRLDISGVPTDVDLWANVTVEGSGDTTIAFLVPASSPGGVQLVVPLHPVTPAQGGAVRIEVTDGGLVSSNSVALQIDPLPAAPGAYAALVDSLEHLLDGWLEQSATNRESLRTTPVGLLPVSHLQLLLIHNALDHPDNPNSMRALADGDIPLFATTPFDRDLLDALVAASGTAGFVQRKLAFVDTLTAPVLPQGESTHELAALARRRADTCIEGPTFGIDGDSCGLLSQTMRYQSALAVEAASAAQDVENQIQTIVFTTLGLTPAAPYAAGVAGTFWAAKTIEEGARGLYPSSFVSDATDFDADPLQFPEDFTEDGLWNHFRVTAVSEGWSFDRAVFQAIMQVLGAVGSGPGDVVDTVAGSAQGAAVQEAVDTISSFVLTESTNLAIDELIGDEGFALSYCPQTWAGIDCTGAPHSVGSSNSAVLTVDDASRSYRPEELGSAQLRVETVAGQFGTAHTGEDKVIVTEAIEVFIDPFQARVGTNETVQFSVRVTNAIDARVAWTATSPDFVSDDASATLVTPENPWNPAIEVRALSLASTGLRVPGAPERSDTAPVTYADSLVIVQITPGYECVSNDGRVDLTAEVIGVEDPVLTWRVDPGWGSVVPTGPLTARYTPPPEGTTDDTIVVEVVDHPEAVDTAHMRVSACTCYYDIQIVGGNSWVQSGGDVAFVRFEPEPGFGVISWFLLFSDEYPNLSGSILGDENDPLPQPGETGTWPIAFAFVPGPNLFYESMVDDAPSTMSVHIDSYTGDIMEGSMTGTAARRDAEGEVIDTVVVNVSFRAGAFSGSWPCE